MENSELIRMALKARKNAYTPYSHWAVGAALETADGEVFLGCNIENAGFSATNCAERTAFFSAVCAGHHDFVKIAIVGGKAGEKPTVFCPPCGVCRQVMREFCNPDTFQIILGIDPSHSEVYTLKQLLPQGFGPKDLEGVC